MKAFMMRSQQDKCYCTKCTILFSFRLHTCSVPEAWQALPYTSLVHGHAVVLWQYIHVCEDVLFVAKRVGCPSCCTPMKTRMRTKRATLCAGFSSKGLSSFNKSFITNMRESISGACVSFHLCCGAIVFLFRPCLVLVSNRCWLILKVM